MSVYSQPPSREALQTALHAFIELYAHRHLELDAQRRRQVISRDEFSFASRRLTAIKAHIEASWLNTPFALPPEYQFDPQELSDLIEVEIAGCQILTTNGAETLPGEEALVESLHVIETILKTWKPSQDGDDDDDSFLFGDMPYLWRDP